MTRKLTILSQEQKKINELEVKNTDLTVKLDETKDRLAYTEDALMQLLFPSEV